MQRWFTSDLHFWHENIIRFSDRPYADAKEMNEALVDNWNTFVKPEDHVYNLGDVTLRRGGKDQQEEFIALNRKLNGHKRLFLGNHDHWDTMVYLRAGFEKIYATWRDEQNIIYSHFPLHPSSLGGVQANVHGHIHSNPSPEPAVFHGKDGNLIIVPYINICVEWTNYHPINFDQLQERILQAREAYASNESLNIQENLDPGSQGRVK